jgi:hypothetical protein
MKKENKEEYICKEAYCKLNKKLKLYRSNFGRRLCIWNKINCPEQEKYCYIYDDYRCKHLINKEETMKAEELKVNRVVVIDKRMYSIGMEEDVVAKGNVYKKSDFECSKTCNSIDIELDTGYSVRLFFDEDGNK